MLYAIGIAAAIVLGICIVGWLVGKATEGSTLAGLTAITIGIVALGALINAVTVQSAKGPCLEYQTTLMYNSALKQTMPVRSCVRRGEWVHE